MSQRLGQKSGFSLVEVLIVVGIIGILAALGIPQYHFFLVKSKRAEATLLLKAAGTGEETYFSAYDQYYPPQAPAGCTNGCGSVWGAEGNAVFGLGPEVTKFGWRFNAYWRFSAAGETKDRTLGYGIQIFQNLDVDFPMDYHVIQKNSGPFQNCLQGVPFVMTDDLTNRNHPCW